MSAKKRMLVLGVTGMLGSRMYKFFSSKSKYIVYGTARNIECTKGFFKDRERKNIIKNIDARDVDKIEKIIKKIKPKVVINCVGIIKQSNDKKNTEANIELNALMPQKIAGFCMARGVRFIQISTDCVFSGKKGQYAETDTPDSNDLYGMTKKLGEVDDGASLTIRTSIIGHELKNKTSLLEWFLSSKGSVKGYSRAIFSGFPTVSFCEILDRYVLSNGGLKGIYHISSHPISKYELLRKINKVYGKNLKIIKYADFKCNRSLNSDCFRQHTGFKPKSWDEYIAQMYEDYSKNYKRSV